MRSVLRLVLNLVLRLVLVAVLATLISGPRRQNTQASVKFGLAPDSCARTPNTRRSVS